MARHHLSTILGTDFLPRILSVFFYTCDEQKDDEIVSLYDAAGEAVCFKLSFLDSSLLPSPF